VTDDDDDDDDDDEGDDVLMNVSSEDMLAYYVSEEMLHVNGKLLTVKYVQAQKGRRGISPLILNLCTRWRRMDNTTPLPLFSSERAPVITGNEAGWAPKPKSKGCGKGKLSCFHLLSNPEPSSPWPVAAPTNLSRPNSTNTES
jgi:hypothetical protein